MRSGEPAYHTRQGWFGRTLPFGYQFRFTSDHFFGGWWRQVIQVDAVIREGTQGETSIARDIDGGDPSFLVLVVINEGAGFESQTLVSPSTWPVTARPPGENAQQSIFDSTSDMGVALSSRLSPSLFQTRKVSSWLDAV